jgi:hypothetical protein
MAIGIASSQVDNPSAGGGGGTPGGSDTYVQYNDAGAFGGDAGMTYNETTDTLSLAGSVIGTKLVARQSGGTPDVDDVWVTHDGDNGFVRAKSGWLGFDSGVASTQVSFAISPLDGFVVFRAARGLAWSSNDPLVDGTDFSLTRTAPGVLQIRSGITGAGALNLCKITPAQLTGDVNDYDPTAGWNQRWSADAARNVTGMAAGQDGAVRFLWNVGTQTITLKDESTSTASAAANRFLTATGADLALATKKCAMAFYDAVSTRWRVTLLP